MAKAVRTIDRLLTVLDSMNPNVHAEYIVGVCNAEKNIAPGLKQLLLAAETLLMNGEKELPKVET